jgi:hypothetical protein
MAPHNISKEEEVISSEIMGAVFYDEKGIIL